MGILEIDHIIAKATGGTDDEKNLWLACRLCNNFKAPIQT
ncbi:MAG: HNH endonuclease [Pseudanabaena sp. CAN_BIN31]|nr:HNH endonuclease [Pseudanabaena sp. CAN_BIN31]